MMAQTHPAAIWLPLVAATPAFICTILVHALALAATVSYVRHERRIGRTGVSFWADLAVVAPAVCLVLVAHLIEIAFWGVLLIACGEFHEFGTAYYHSAMNYTTLGYGDIVMSPSWKLLGPLEAANGAVMFGVSTGLVFALIQLLISIRFHENLPEEEAVA